MIFGSEPSLLDRILSNIYKLVIFACVFALGFVYYLVWKQLGYKKLHKDDDDTAVPERNSSPVEQESHYTDGEARHADIDDDAGEKFRPSDTDEEEEESTSIVINKKPIDIRQVIIEQNEAHAVSPSTASEEIDYSHFSEEQKLAAKKRISKVIQKKLA